MTWPLLFRHPENLPTHIAENDSRYPCPPAMLGRVGPPFCMPGTYVYEYIFGSDNSSQQGLLRTVFIKEGVGFLELELLVPILEVVDKASGDDIPENVASKIMADGNGSGALLIRRHMLDIVNNAAMSSADPPESLSR